MISIQTLISIISVCGAVIFGVLATSRNSKSDIRNDTEERVSMNVILVGTLTLTYLYVLVAQNGTK